MAEYAGPNLTKLPGWRIGILFAFFLLFAICWHAALRALDRHFKRRGKRGLRNVLRSLKEELLTLGVISLLLVAVEKYLLMICIPCQGEGDPRCYWGCDPGPEYDEKECAEAQYICGVGSEPFWSQASIIQAHILLFVIAAVHILYTAAVMLLCLWKVGRWKVYEGQDQWEMQPIVYSSVPVPGGNPLMSFLRCFISMFTESVNADVYSGLRRLFVERMDLEPDFDFHGFLVESMEEEMAAIISVEWMMWIIVILWVTLPPSTWVMVWMGGLSALSMLVVGVKLEGINNQLTVDAYLKYGERCRCSPSHHSSKGGPFTSGLRAIKTGLSRLSPFPSKASPRDSASGVATPAELGGGGEEGGLCLRAGGEPQGAQRTRHRGMEGVAAASVAAASVAAADKNVQPAATVLEMPALGRGHRENGGMAGCVDDTADGEAGAEGGGPGPRKSFLSWALPGHAVMNGSAGAAVLGGQRSSVFRRCLGWLGSLLPLPQCEGKGCWDWLPWAGGGSESRVLPRANSFSPNYRGLDAAKLFWFGRPHFMLRIIQLCYFENSLALATMLFSLWQNVDFDWGRGVSPQWPIIVGSAVLDICLLVFSSLLVLPVYAMTNAAGSHCPDSVIKHALKHNIKPELARALQRLSMEPTVQEGDEAGLPPMPPPSPGSAAAAAGTQGVLGGRESPVAVMAGQGQQLWGTAQQEGRLRGVAVQEGELASAGGVPAPAAGPSRRFFGGAGLLSCLHLGPPSRAGVGASVKEGGGRGPDECLPPPPPPLPSKQGPPSLGRRSMGGGPSLGRRSMGGSPSLGRHSMGSTGGDWEEAAGAEVERIPLGPQVFEPSGENEESQRSVTRLLGAMYRRQLQQSLQRSSMGRPHSPTAAQQEQPGWEGKRGWPESQHDYRSMPSAAEAAQQLEQEPTRSMPASLRASLDRAQQAQRRPSIREVQGLFSEQLQLQQQQQQSEGARDISLSVPAAPFRASMARAQQPQRMPSLQEVQGLFKEQQQQEEKEKESKGAAALPSPSPGLQADASFSQPLPREATLGIAFAAPPPTQPEKRERSPRRRQFQAGAAIVRELSLTGGTDGNSRLG